jgi:hypothetical protein
MDGEYLNNIAEELDEKYRSEPARYRDSACTPCLGPRLTPMVVVERETWEALFHATTFNELGCDLQISKASKALKLVGFPPNMLSSLMKDIESNYLEKIR